MQGKRCYSTNNRSKTQDNIGVTHIGLRYEYEDGGIILGIDVTIACFHKSREMQEVRIRLY
jgi:hypothetical protein